MKEFVGKIVHGNGLGKNYGMPTANMEIDEKVKSSLQGIKYGVYASKVYISDNEYDFDEKNEFMGLTNIGTKPTIDDSGKITIETNILDFDKDIYDKYMKLKLVKYIRGIIKFNSLTEVKKQVDKDKMIVREVKSF